MNSEILGHLKRTFSLLMVPCSIPTFLTPKIGGFINCPAVWVWGSLYFSLLQDYKVSTSFKKWILAVGHLRDIDTTKQFEWQKKIKNMQNFILVFCRYILNIFKIEEFDKSIEKLFQTSGQSANICLSQLEVFFTVCEKNVSKHENVIQ